MPPSIDRPSPLIRTKLRPPFTRPGLVSRPRLQEQIALGLRGPLTLITAPAGFGKTTLVASCAAGSGMPVAWLSLDKDDNQPGRFLTYLTAALHTTSSRIGEEAAQIMAGIQQAQPEAVLTSLINDLDSASTEMTLVLDDYQLISSQAVHKEVAFLLQHRPNTFHLVIATRSDPPLPLARLRARGEMIELRAADLRFTAEEAAQFLNDVMGLRLDAGSVAMLEERTEGWIAGLQMASLALQGSLSLRNQKEPDRKDVFRFIEGFSGTNRYILDYLLEEVLASQPPEIQHFLLCTSILERLTAPLCDALLAGGEETRPSDSVLEYLERENLFLVSLEDDPSSGSNAPWFRYHHLFADLLRVKLQQTKSELVPHLHIRASTWFEENGFVSEAIQHLFAAQEIDRAADLIEHYGPARWAQSDPSIIQMAENLPPEMLIARPKIGIYQAWLYIIPGNVEKALPLLNDLSRNLAKDPHSREQWIQTIIGLALAFLGLPVTIPGFDPVPDYQVLDEIPADEIILRDTADLLCAMALGRRKKFDRAEEFAIRCIQREEARNRARSFGTIIIPTLVPFLARIYLIQGRLHAAASLCRKYLDPIKAKGIRFIYSYGSMNNALGEVLYEWNCVGEAEKQIRYGLQASEPWVDIMNEAFGLIALARVLIGMGDYAGAMQIVEKLEKRLQGHLRPYEFEEDFRTLRVRVQLANGDLESASRWADQILLSEDFHLHPDRYLLTLARIQLTQGRFDCAEEMLTSIPSFDWASNPVTRQLEYHLLRAAAVYQQNRSQEALGLIKACLALAEPEGYIRAFLDAGEPIRDLLAAYLRTSDPEHAHFAQKVLDIFSPSSAAPSAGPQPAGLLEPLSEREQEVLHLMALGKTNQEIARQLVVARGTIKAHAANIYRKLDVTNRTEAVARARQLGILP